MKSVLVILKSVVTPIFVILLCLAGITSSIISFAIEYFTLQPLLTLTSDNPIVKVIPIALIITIVLETTKNGCCIVRPGLKGKASSLCKTATVLWLLLMIFSLLCTVVYTTNTLYSKVAEDFASDVGSERELLKEYETNLSTLKMELNEITNTRNNKLSDLALDYSNEENYRSFVDNYALPYKITMETARENFSTVSDKYSTTYVSNNSAPEYKKVAIEAAEKTFNDAEANYNKALEDAKILYDQRYIDSEASIKNNYDEQITRITTNISELEGIIAQAKDQISRNESDRYAGKYTQNLNVFLLFFERLLSPQTSSHERFYQISVMAISLLVAAMLEVIIFFANNYIGQSLSILSKQLIDDVVDDELTRQQKIHKDKCEAFVELFIKAILCSGVYYITYILIMLFKSSNINLSLHLAMVMFAAYFIIQWIIKYMTVQTGDHHAIQYSAKSKVGVWLNKVIGTEYAINTMFGVITTVYNRIPKWAWKLLVYLVCPAIPFIFFADKDISNIDEFVWQFASAITAFLFGNVITKSNHAQP